MRKSERRRGNGRESERGRETENGTEIEIGRGTEEHVAVIPTAATPVEHQTGKGADPGIAGGPGAETRTERENANAAGMAGFIEPPLSPYSLRSNNRNVPPDGNGVVYWMEATVHTCKSKHYRLNYNIFYFTPSAGLKKHSGG